MEDKNKDNIIKEEESDRFTTSPGDESPQPSEDQNIVSYPKNRDSEGSYVDRRVVDDIQETLKEVTAVLKQVNKEKESLEVKNQELEKRIGELEKMEPKALHDSEKSVVEGFYDTYGHSMDLVHDNAKKDYETAKKELEKLNSIFSI